MFFRELVKSPTFDLTFALWPLRAFKCLQLSILSHFQPFSWSQAVLILISSLVMALQVQYHGFDVGFALGYWSARPANEHLGA